MDKTTSSANEKLYYDGSCTQGICGGGGLIRNSQGITLWAYCIILGPGTSNMAEAAAMLYGLKWCANRKLVLTMAETDPLLLTKCVKGEWKSP